VQQDEKSEVDEELKKNVRKQNKIIFWYHLRARIAQEAVTTQTDLFLMEQFDEDWFGPIYVLEAFWKNANIFRESPYLFTRPSE
jgi:hypothetical protein